MECKYSVAIYPPLTVMTLVANMKEELANAIGWYHSRNSKAHITICEFKADDEKGINKIKSALSRACIIESPLELYFDHYGSYSNGAFCLLPSVHTKGDLRKLMKRIQEGLHVRDSYKSNSPHISIARKLDAINLKTASELFNNVNTHFHCDRIVLRVFDPKVRQYTIVKEFMFQDQPDQQLTLF